MFIDMHCDTLLKLYEHPGTKLNENTFQIDLQRMKKSLIDLQNFAIFIELGTVADPYVRYQEMLAIYQAELAANQDLIRPALTYDDYISNQNEHLLSAMLTMEEGAPLAGRIDRLEQCYQDGVRMLTLTWNMENELGFPNANYVDPATQILTNLAQKGLKAAGRDIVTRMAELGMIIDVSHGSDQLVWDVLATTAVPFVASHSNCRSLCPHSRNLSDELIRAIAERGGVIGLNYFADFITFDSSLSLPVQLAKHADHLKNIGGLGCIGLGSDFDGIRPSEDLPDILALELLVDALQKNGFTAREIDAIGYQNVARLYKDLL
ncbi:dipeptidase [Enterococcus italicus]